MLTPRPRQIKAVQDSRRALIERKRRAIIVAAPTGFGKTGVAAGIMQSALAKGNSVLFIADRRKLVLQAQAKLLEFGISSGVVIAGHDESPREQVQIATVQTLAVRLNGWSFNPQIIVIDEAHRSNGKSFKAITDRFPKAVLVGLTATPVGASGRGLGKDHDGLFEEIIPTASIRELIEDGTLCPFRYFLPELLDTSGVPIKDGEYDQAELQKRMDERPGIVGDFAKYWLENCKGRPTLTFAPSIKEAGRICAAAVAAGIRAVTIDSTNEDHEGDEALRGLESGTLDMVVLVGMWIEGLDCPAISCIDLMCATASITKFLQMIGRGFRPAPGKPDLIVVDHFGNAGRVVDAQFIPKHGMPDWRREWDLAGRKVGRGGPKPDDPKPLMVCPQCFVTHEPAPKCVCGYVYTAAERKPPKKLKGRIVQLTPEQMEQKEAAKVEKQRAKEQAALDHAARRHAEKLEEWSCTSFEDLLAIEQRRGYARNWARIRWKILEPKLLAKAARAEARMDRQVRRIVG